MPHCGPGNPKYGDEEIQPSRRFSLASTIGANRAPVKLRALDPVAELLKQAEPAGSGTVSRFTAGCSTYARDTPAALNLPWMARFLFLQKWILRYVQCLTPRSLVLSAWIIC
jgi:hypothetical protein